MEVAIPDTPGASVEFDKYRFEFVIGEIDQGEFTSFVTVNLKAYGANDWYLGAIHPSIEISMVSQMQRTIPVTLSSPLRDVFVVFQGVDRYDNLALMIKINPLISCVWLGFGLLIIGTLASTCARRGKPNRDVEGKSLPDSTSKKAAIKGAAKKENASKDSKKLIEEEFDADPNDVKAATTKEASSKDPKKQKGKETAADSAALKTTKE